MRLNYINLSLLFCLLFFHTGFLIAGVEPVEEKTEKRTETSRKVKKVNSKKKLKKHKRYFANSGFLSTLIFQFIFFISGLILVGFGAPLSIAFLWIIGMVFLAIACTISVVGIFYTTQENTDFVKGLGKLVVTFSIIFLILMLILLYFTLGLSFLIWGLIAAIPALWITGVLSFFVIVSIIFMTSKL